MAGLPMIQKDNSDHLVAMQTIAQKKDVGIFFKDADDLCRQLKDKKGWLFCRRTYSNIGMNLALIIIFLR